MISANMSTNISEREPFFSLVSQNSRMKAMTSSLDRLDDQSGFSARRQAIGTLATRSGNDAGLGLID